MIGDGPLEDGLRRRAEELGIANRVRFLGFCEDAAARIAAAQVFVLASRFEAFPYSILEAMRAGLPVVASHVGGIPEAVVPGRTGLLAPVGDVEVLRRCLANLIVNPGLRQQLGDRGRERYLEHFTLDRMFARTLGIYQDVLSAASASDRREPLADSARQLEPTAAFAGWSAGPKSTKVR